LWLGEITARSEVSVGLPVNQRKILEKIENALRGSDPRLAALFSIFTRLTRDEEMPRIEQIRARAAIIMARIGYRLAAFGRWFRAPARARLRTAMFFPIALAIVASAVLVGARFPSSSRCATPQRTTKIVPSTTRARVCTQGLVNPAILGR
jgi:Protein of unknown function (DUF3040)